MSSRLLRFILLGIAVVVVTLPSLFCTGPQKGAKSADQPTSPWLNVYDTAAHYVGMNTCRGCHEEVYKTFIQTGMGQSFAPASRLKSAADFSPAHALVYDSALDYYYKPYWQHDSLYIMEYRTEAGDTVHKRTQRIDYIVGSGQHTNSHIFGINGYLYQAPITFYTQKHRWDLAPGFEKGGSSRFSRMIQLECMSCHNGYPQFDPGSENKFTRVPDGIDCERCHGPGSLHVQDKMAGKIVDTSKTPDYTIVNPRRLSTELQNNVCQRCHLQGIAVVNDGKTFFDYRPGMKLSEVMNVFMPQYEGAQDKMIMASHVERMKKSDCFIQSGKMSCINCHNPHVSVKFTPRSQYINACQSCHGTGQGQHQCTESAAKRATGNNDCVTCHMPHNSSIDIPHVAVTDHYIRRRPLDDAQKKDITAFLGMQCFNNDHPDDVTKARGFMEFYERYVQSPGLLDSALRHLGYQAEYEAKEKQNRDYIRAYFLQKGYNKVIEYASALQPDAVTDAWTAYRCGESYFQQGDAAKALPWYARAVALWPSSLDFLNKYGTCLLVLGKMPDALAVFNNIIKANPDHTSASTNLGYIHMQQGNATMAYDFMLHARHLDPDYEQNLINLAIWLHTNKRDTEAQQCLVHLISKHPQNQQARAMLADLGM